MENLGMINEEGYKVIKELEDMVEIDNATEAILGHYMDF
jgi:hypothetical protein